MHATYDPSQGAPGNGATQPEHKCLCGAPIPDSCDMCRECFDKIYPNAPKP